MGPIIAWAVEKQSMRKLSVMGALIVVAAVGCSKKSTNAGTSLNSTDQQFITSASFNNVDEIDAGNLASTNAADTNVKSFGTLMVNDYGHAQSALVLIADNAKFTVLSSPDMAHQQELTALQLLTGVAFDTSYLRLQINDDQAAISLYQAEQTNGQSTAVKEYVSTYLPVIQAHLIAADSLIKIWVGH
jgi:putative membrane protein